MMVKLCERLGSMTGWGWLALQLVRRSLGMQKCKFLCSPLNLIFIFSSFFFLLTLKYLNVLLPGKFPRKHYKFILFARAKNPSITKVINEVLEEVVRNGCSQVRTKRKKTKMKLIQNIIF